MQKFDCGNRIYKREQHFKSIKLRYLPSSKIFVFVDQVKYATLGTQDFRIVVQYKLGHVFLNTRLDPLINLKQTKFKKNVALRYPKAKEALTPL